MPPQEQADVWMALRDRMKTNWAELTLQEKKAGRFPFLRRNYAEVMLVMGHCVWPVSRCRVRVWEDVYESLTDVLSAL